MTFANLNFEFNFNYDELIWDYCIQNNFIIKKSEDEKEYIKQLEESLLMRWGKVRGTDERKFIFYFDVEIDLREELELISKEDDKFLFNYMTKFGEYYIIYFENRNQINKFLYDFFDSDVNSSFVFHMKYYFCYIYNLNNGKVIDFRVPDCAGIEIY